MVRFHGAAFKNIGVNGALRKKFNSRELSGFFFKHADEFRTDDLPFLLRIAHARELVQKAVYRIHINEVCVHLVAEHIDDLFRFAFSQQTMIHVYADQLLADCLNQKRCDDG